VLSFSIRPHVFWPALAGERRGGREGGRGGRREGGNLCVVCVGVSVVVFVGGVVVVVEEKEGLYEKEK